MPVSHLAHKVTDSERTDDIKISESTTFEGLMLSNETLQGLTSSGFIKPSPIQLRAIPLGKCGFDLIVEAKSGTGKTAVFGIIALEMIIKNGGFQVLILAPTREIAAQIGDVITSIGSGHSALNVETVMGGTNISSDIERLKTKKYQILVGSPGRITHLIKKDIISTRSVRLMVLDEADKLMEDSFQKDINYIYSRLPERKQLIAASATYTAELRHFIENYMKTPSHICPHISSILLGITQNIVIVQSHENTVRQNKIKLNKVIEILSHIPFKQCLIFCQYQIRAQSICETLCEEGWPSEFLAGSQNQCDRLKSLKKLQSYSCRILVATDLAARGIDASNVDLVINIDPPGDYPTYLHRIGRAGRYGSKGLALTILSGKEESALSEKLSFLNELNITKLDLKLENGNDTQLPITKILVNKTIPKSVANNTDSSYLSIIGPLKNKNQPYVPYEEIVSSLKNVDVEPSNAEEKLSVKNINLMKYVTSNKDTLLLSPNTPTRVIFSKSNSVSRKVAHIPKKTESLHMVPVKNRQHICNEAYTKTGHSNLKSNGEKLLKNISPPLLAKRNTTYVNDELKNGHASRRNDYLNWRRQLDEITKRIEQVVYIRTLLNIDNDYM